MTTGLILVIVGVFCMFFNTIGLIAFNVKMRKENERAFITFRSLREPRTTFLNAKKTTTMDLKQDVIDIHVQCTEKALDAKIDDTILLQDFEFIDKIYINEYDS